MIDFSDATPTDGAVWFFLLYQIGYFGPSINTRVTELMDAGINSCLNN